MKVRTMTSAVALSCALALSAACDTADTNMNRTDEPGAVTNTTDQARQADTTQAEAQPISVTGCLQESGMNTFILTRINQPQSSVGTSGKVTGDSVAQEQMRAAANAYRLEAEGDQKFDDMVGKQVRVTGRIVERSDLPGTTATAGSDAARRDQPAGSAADRNRPGADADANERRDADRPEIDAGDLAEMRVTSIAKVAEVCGASAK